MPDINITSIAIENFRGISQQVVLDLVNKSNTQTNSLIIYGDNGTGKSSIVDAIQFALQGNIGRERKMSSCRSYSSNDKLPCVEIKLSDLRTITRKFYYDDNGKLEIFPHLRRDESFKISPFVLRRSDILRFINTSDQKRQVVFFDYRLQSSSIEIDYEKYNYSYLIEQKENLEKERTTKKAKRRNTTIKLAKRIGISPENIPLSKKEFDDFICIKVHAGLKAPQRKNLNKGDLGYADPITHQYIKLIRELTQQIHDIEQKIKNLQKTENEIARRASYEEVFIEISKILTDSFLAISNNQFVDHIELVCGDISNVSLSVFIHLKNGKICNPNEIFSEANLDLLALLIFLSFMKESVKYGQAKLLVLDDVFQSVDSTVRVEVVDYVLKNFKDWQLIFTVHDLLWKNQLCDLFRRNGKSFIESDILRWTFDEGAIILNTSQDIDYYLLKAIETGDAINICSQSGLLLEEMCHNLSYLLPVSVTRKKYDKYTLGDLWPGIFKVLKKSNIKELAEEVDKWLHLRNLVGAHYNEWARSVSQQEVKSFAESVLQLFWQIRCNKCFRWIEPIEQQKHWSCRCKNVSIEKI